MIDSGLHHRTLAIALVACLASPSSWADDARAEGKDPASMHPASMRHAPGAAHRGHNAPGTVTEAVPASPERPLLAGQYAFATIAEIVDLLERDPSTDWSRVDLESLRRHLIDMDRVTLGARVASEIVAGGARFAVTSTREETRDSIRRMTRAHAASTDHGSGGVPWRYVFEEHPAGASLTVQGEGEEASIRIRALGFIGILVAGTHHPRHHLAIARGERPHEH